MKFFWTKPKRGVVRTESSSVHIPPPKAPVISKLVLPGGKTIPVMREDAFQLALRRPKKVVVG